MHLRQCLGSLTVMQAAMLELPEAATAPFGGMISDCTCSAALPEVAVMAMMVEAADLLAVADG